jgi:hypothetical protein
MRRSYPGVCDREQSGIALDNDEFIRIVIDNLHPMTLQAARDPAVSNDADPPTPDSANDYCHQ